MGLILSKESELKLYTIEYRNKILTKLISLFEKDSRIASVIIVGSGAYDYIDDLSDIDLAIVTFNDYELMPIFKDWKEKILANFGITESFEVIYSPESLLHGFLTDEFLEINIGFQNQSNISAKRKHWKIAFDKTGELKEIMHSSWKKTENKTLLPRFEYLVSGSWHYIRCALTALYRENYWRTIVEIENLKNEWLEIIALREKSKVNTIIRSQNLPKELDGKLRELLIPNVEKEELFRAIKTLTEFFYQDVRLTSEKLNGKDYSILEKRMKNYLELMEKKIFD